MRNSIDGGRSHLIPFHRRGSGFGLRVDYTRWGGTAEDLRHVALSAPNARTRERALALYDIAQGSCATRVAARTGRHRQTVMGWVHAYNARVLTRSGFAAPAADPPCAQIAAARRDAVCAAQRAAAILPLEGADPAPRVTLKRLGLYGLPPCGDTAGEFGGMLGTGRRSGRKAGMPCASGSIAVGSGILMLQLHGFDEAVGACMPQSRRADGFDRHRIAAAAAGVCRSTQTGSAAHSSVAPSAQTSIRSPRGCADADRRVRGA